MRTKFTHPKKRLPRGRAGPPSTGEHPKRPFVGRFSHSLGRPSSTPSAPRQPLKTGELMDTFQVVVMVEVGIIALCAVLGLSWRH